MYKYLLSLSLFYVVFFSGFSSSFAIPLAPNNNGEVSSNPIGQCVTVNLTKNLKFGSRDSGENGDIYNLQRLLVSLGYMTGQPSGYFGPVTLGAVKKLQKYEKISQTGFVGPLTRDRIGHYACTDYIMNNSNKSASIKIIEPNGGGVYKVGSKYNLKWETQGAPNNSDVYMTFTIPKDNILNGNQDVEECVAKASVSKSGLEWWLDKSDVRSCGSDMVQMFKSNTTFKTKIKVSLVTGVYCSFLPNDPCLNNPIKVIATDESDDYITINNN